MTPTPAMLSAGAHALKDAEWWLTRQSLDRHKSENLEIIAERVWMAMEAEDRKP
ncbi:MAG: hypothetical protein Q7S17_08230 [Xanthobacteraceae bacterium]|nr:hypothetical protein [Xanthobacteraceae bacterium]